MKQPNKPELVDCPDCGGSGFDEDDEDEMGNCIRCHGVGSVLERSDDIQPAANHYTEI